MENLILMILTVVIILVACYIGAIRFLMYPPRKL